MYLSDVNRVPDATMAYLKTLAIDVLVVDALLRKQHPSHFSLEEAVDCARALRP